MKYLIIIEKSNNGFCAYSPDIPGCIAAAETEEETRTLMKEAIVFHLEGLESAYKLTASLQAKAIS